MPIETEEDLSDIRDELNDRYGDIPRAVENLFMIALVRSMGSSLGFEKIRQNDSSVLIYPERLDARIWSALAPQYKGRILLSAGEKPYISIRIKRGDDILRLLKEIFKNYIQFRSENG